MFFKDGFTDIRGRFDYAKVSGSDSSDKKQFKTFAIFMSHEKLGDTIKEADATKLKSEGKVVSNYDDGEDSEEGGPEDESSMDED